MTLATARVEGNFSEWFADRGEVPGSGRVVLTPTVNQIRVSGRIVHIRQVVARIVDGVLRPMDSDDDFITVLATAQVGAAPENFQYRVNIDLRSVTPRQDPRAFLIDAAPNTTVFLHAVMPAQPQPPIERVYELGRGERGEVGPVGPVGPIGPQGPQGIAGPVGPVGPVGPQGNQGPQGFQGVAGQIVGVTTETGAPGSQAAIGLGGTAEQRVFHFTVPTGPKGDKGDKGETGEGVEVFLVPNSMWPPAPDPNPLHWYVRIADPA